MSQHQAAILIVAHDAERRNTYRRLLPENGPDGSRFEYRFWEAPNAEEALLLCRRQQPDCILLDSQLPNAGGPEFLAELARVKGDVLIPVIMVGQPGATPCAADGDAAQDAICLAILSALERARLLRTIEEQCLELERANDQLATVKRELAEVNQLKSEFLANASHELRTPLHSIIGFLRLVLEGMCDSPEDERNSIQLAVTSAESLLKLVNDLLDISKIEAGKMALDLSDVNLAKLFDELWLLTRLHAQERDLGLDFHPPEDDSLTLRADYNKLRQILLNLVGNSLKFTDAGGVTVRAIPAPERGFVSIVVEDTGIGIRPELQAKVFGKFVQGDGSITRRYGGTGLGLTVAKSLVELMGGVIKLDSEGVGKGTRVSFTVPISRPADAESPDWRRVASEGAAVKGDPRNPLLLIAEDDTHFRNMMEKMAHQAGYSTIYALTADDAVTLARKLKPVAITLDHALLVPEHAALTDGWDAYAILQTDMKTAGVPVLFVSGYGTQLEERLAQMPNVERPRFMMKPFDRQEFIEALNEATGKTKEDGEAASEKAASAESADSSPTP
jgi:signal transduction histidine kinase